MQTTLPAPHHTAAQRAAGALLAALGGACLAVQGRVNGQLGQLLGDGVFAGVISTGIGLAVLVLWVAVLPATRRGARRLAGAVRTGRLRWWQCLGGAFGGLVVGSQGVVVPMLGVAVFTVAVVGGMVVSGLVVDKLGVGPGGPAPVTGPRVAGAGLAVVAVVLAVSPRFGHPTGLWLAVLPALAGIGMAWQVAMNGLVRREADDVVVPTMVNFAAGLVVLLVAMAVDLVVRGAPPAPPPGPWWLFVGGPLGIVAVLTAVAAVRLVGVLLVGLASVAGQLAAAVVLDAVAPTGGGGLTVQGVAGAALTMVAVGIAALRLEGWVRDRDDPGRQGDP